MKRGGGISGEMTICRCPHPVDKPYPFCRRPVDSDKKNRQKFPPLRTPLREGLERPRQNFVAKPPVEVSLKISTLCGKFVENWG